MRRPAFRQLPDLVKAVLAAEDKHFFQHRGLDLKRIAKAAYVNLLERRKGQGASTLTMQLARSLWLTSEKSWSRKAAEALIALHLERKLSKEAIFDHYATSILEEVPLTAPWNGAAARLLSGQGTPRADAA